MCKKKKKKVKKLDLIEQNQCDSWVQQIKTVQHQLKHLRQYICCSLV